jgi:hypothetical protein
VFRVGITLSTAVRNYWSARAARVSSGYETIEGTVEKFVPQPRAGHDLERFDVSGAHFLYSNYMLTPGFHQVGQNRAYPTCRLMSTIVPIVRFQAIEA